MELTVDNLQMLLDGTEEWRDEDQAPEDRKSRIVHVDGIKDGTITWWETIHSLCVKYLDPDDKVHRKFEHVPRWGDVDEYYKLALAKCVKIASGDIVVEACSTLLFLCILICSIARSSINTIAAKLR